MADNDKRLRYYNGQFLREQDFIAEQEYHLERQRGHNRQLHTPGIAEGLTVTAGVGDASATVSPGTAIDREGRVIVLTESRTLQFASFSGWVLVVISYGEEPSDPATSGDEGDTRWWERPDVEVIAESGAPAADLRIRLARLQIAANHTVSQHDTSVRNPAVAKLAAGTLRAQNPLGGSPQFVQDQNGNQSPLAIGTGDNVGIGTNTPGFVLTVAGNISTAPLAEVSSQGNESSIRYMNNGGMAWHVGSGGQGGAKNFFFWNHEKGVVATIAPEGTLTAKGLKASTNAPGLALAVAGNTGDGPMAELKSQGNEASIRYADNDGVDWIAGSGGQAGPGSFFFWNSQKQFVTKIAPDGTLTAKGLKAVTSEPGTALRVEGDTSGGPIAELTSLGDEASIRYVDNDGVSWHVGSGGHGGAKNFFFWNDTSHIVTTITPEGTLTAKGLKAVTNAPGIAFTVSGANGDGPIAELKSTGNETSIRYSDNDGVDWISGTGGQGGTGNFFFWNSQKQFVAKISPDGTLALKGGLTVEGGLSMRRIIVTEAFGQLDVDGTVKTVHTGFQPKFISMEGRAHAWLGAPNAHLSYGGALGGFCQVSDGGQIVRVTGHGPHVARLEVPPYLTFFNAHHANESNAFGSVFFMDHTLNPKLRVYIEVLVESITPTGFKLKLSRKTDVGFNPPAVFGLDMSFAVLG